MSAVPETATGSDEAAAQKREEVPSGEAAATRVMSGADEWLKTGFTLPRCDPLLPASTWCLKVTQLKVCLARLQLEAEEKAQCREA